MYNLTALQNVTTVVELVAYANTVTNSLLLTLFVMSVFFIMLMALKKWDFDASLLVSSFVCFMISAMLTYAHLMPMLWTLVYLIIAAFTAFYMQLSK
jgi:hypothetical protein